MSRCNRSLPPRGGLFFAFIAVNLLWAVAAHGHGGGSDEDKGSVYAVLDPLPPELSSLRVQLRKTLAPQLLVANPTGKALTIEDESGRLFLRIGPENTEGDLGTAAFHRTNTLMAPGAIPADASGDPRWTVVEATPNWGWFDLRLRTDAIDLPHEVVESGERAFVGQWSVPVRLGDTESVISGRFEYVPTAVGIVQAQVVDVGALKGQALVRAMPGSARPGLFLSYRGDSPLTLMGEQGEPFLRFSPQGVEANRHSPTWGMVAPAGAPSFVANKADAEVRWAQVSGGSSYGWIEPRAAYADTVEDPTRSGVVKRWKIPISIGDKRSLIEGVTEWFPVEPLASM